MTPRGEQLPPPAEPSSHDELGFDLPAPMALGRARLVASMVLVLAIVATAFFVGYLPKRRAREALAEATKAQQESVEKVQVLKPTVVSSDRALVLPATIQALEETPILPRANGYVKTWSVDIGDKVTDGQVLAEIETPELDQELAQAQSQLAQANAAVVQAKASADLAHTTVDRTQKLLAGGVTSQQDFDTKQGEAQVGDANLHAAQANSAAAAANVQRLKDLKAFSKITAPFAGTITERNIQRGALVTAGQGAPLFKVAILDPMRIIVNVPQDVAPGVASNVAADVTVREFPGVKFPGKVARSARALDPATRTMTTEVRVPNSDGKLIAGMYAEVALTLPSPHQVLEIPATALYTDAKGQRVATVDADGKVHFSPVLLERDTGATVLIASGLDPAAKVVKLANVSLVEGAPVEAEE